MFLPSCSGTVLLKESQMQPATIPIALLVIALAAASNPVVAASAAGPSVDGIADAECAPEAAFVITDRSGHAGTGVRINGARQTRAQLADGDVIELGRTKLRFASAPL